MRLCVLLLTLSLVLAEDYVADDDDICETCDKESVIQRKDYETQINSSFSEIRCLIYNIDKLSCSWSTDSLPEDTQYSASLQHCGTPEDNPLNCTSESSEKLVECQGLIQSDDHMAFKVNVSSNGDWYIICKNYIPADIENLDPPENISTIIKSTNLEIQWLQPRSCCSMEKKCFSYELKINDESVELVEELAFNITNFDPTRSYNIKIRTKIKKDCAYNDNWSNWSTNMLVGPFENVYQLKASVIAPIALVLPMIILAFLLVCKFQRLSEKLFPTIPNPSKNVQMLLDKNDFNQVTHPKPSEEKNEILVVTG